MTKIIEMIGATTHLDRENHRFSKTAFEKAAVEYRTRKRKDPLLIEHDLTLGILGVILKQECVKLADGEYGLKVN